MSNHWVRLGGTGLALYCLWGGVAASRGAEVPYAPGEEQALRAFLQCESMVKGKSNAQLLGARLEDPGTWAGVSWVDYDPYVAPDQPRVSLPYKHVLNIELSASLGGAMEIRAFSYLQLCWILNQAGTTGNRGQYTSIRVIDNPMLKSVVLNYLEASAVEIGGNPNLTSAHFWTSKVGALKLSAPGLHTLRASSLGEPPLNLAAYPELAGLNLEGIDNIETLDLSGCPKIGGLSVTYLNRLRGIRWGGVLELQSVEVSDNPLLASLDLRNAPKLGLLSCQDNAALTNLLAANNPALEKATISGNSNLESLQFNRLPALLMLEAANNERLREVQLQANPKLELFYCQGSGLQALDVSGCPVLNRLIATGNQITQFNGAGLVFSNLTLSLNRLHRATANVAGRTIGVMAYRDGGYVDFDASVDWPDTSKLSVSFGYHGIPKPRNTKLIKTEGTGLPAGYTWKDRFPAAGDVEATFYFGAVVTVMDYYARVEDNPWGDWFGTAYPFTPVVGDPIGPLNAAPRPGSTLQGWYTDEALTQPWNLERDIHRGEMVLYPWWLAEGVPAVVSVRRFAPLNETAATDSVVYRVQFNEPVSGVDATDFALAATGSATGSVGGISAGQGHSFEVSVNAISGSGTLRLDVKGAGTQIADADGNLLSKGYSQGDIYRVGAGETNRLAAFLQAHGIDPSGASGGTAADPDGDGIGNLLEFVLGGNPAAADQGIEPSAEYRQSGGSPSFVYSFRCSPEAAEACRVAVEYSTDLRSWQPAVNGDNGVAVEEQPVAGGKRVTATFGAAAQKLYLRLRVEPK